MSELTHFNSQGQAHMVDVTDKLDTKRIAVAKGFIFMSEQAFAMLERGSSAKGDVLGIARIAAIQATKQTSQLIPLCHPIYLSSVGVEFTLYQESKSVMIEVSAKTKGATGVEMEALSGVMGGLLTIYDMLKAIDKGMKIQDVELVSKSGGKSGDWNSK